MENTVVYIVYNRYKYIVDIVLDSICLFIRSKHFCNNTRLTQVIDGRYYLHVHWITTSDSNAIVSNAS